MTNSDSIPSGIVAGLQVRRPFQPLVLATFLHVGSGGSPTIDYYATYGTGVITVSDERRSTTERNALDHVSTADRVLLLRHWLSLPVAEAARALRVQRPTVYAWERGEGPAYKNADRLHRLFEIASEWRSLSDEPVGALRKELVTSDGKSLVDLLCAKLLRPTVIRAAMKQLRAMRQQEIASRPLSGADLAERFGFRPLSGAEAARNIAREAKGRSGWRSDKT
ncbi:MAG TPA: hypothetical protein VK524_02175 [Polyangiaceae bacterium]|nr:hypothetical protein [Polyangiaceae bacterium]